MKTRRKRKNPIWIIASAAIIVLGAVLAILLWPEEKPQIQISKPEPTQPVTTAPPKPLTPAEKLQAFAENHGLTPDAWPEELVELFEKNPETE